MAEQKGLIQKFKNKIWSRTPRAQSTFDRLHFEAGFIPLLNMTDTESRRLEIKTLLAEAKNAILDPDQKKVVTNKVFTLFFTAGDPWYRGLDNRELALKVVCFLENVTDVGHLNAFIPDLFEEAMQLLSLSWQALDVTNTPWYIVETRPLVWAGKTGAGSPEAKVDAGGVLMMKQRIEELEAQVEAQNQ